MLTKRAQLVVTPGVPGRAPVPAQPAYRICASTPAQGEWQTTCDTSCIPIWDPGSAASGDISQGGAVRPPGWTYICGVPVCKSKWVQTKPAGPIVCTDYPATPAIPGVTAVPARAEYVPIFDWDAGANSVQEFAGDCRTRFTMRKVVGAYVGLTNTRENVTMRERLSHAFYFTQTSNGQQIAQIVEAGRPRGTTFPYTPTTEFEIRRIGSEVVYLVDGEVRLVSDSPFSGTAIVGTSLYGTADIVG